MCKWIVVEASLEFRHADPVKFGEFVASLGFTLKKGVGLPCTNWSRVGAVLLMSPRPRNQPALKHEVWHDRLGLMKVSM